MIMNNNNQPATKDQKEQEELRKKHAPLFALIASGNDPELAAEILGYTPEAVKEILEMAAGRSVVKLPTFEELIAEGKPLAAKRLIDIMATSDTEANVIAASKVLLSYGDDKVDKDTGDRLKAMIAQMQKRITEDNKRTITIDSDSNKQLEIVNN